MAELARTALKLSTWSNFGVRVIWIHFWDTLATRWGTLGSLWRLLADFSVKDASSGRHFRPKCVEYTLFRGFSRGVGTGKDASRMPQGCLKDASPQGCLKEASGRQWTRLLLPTKYTSYYERSSEALTRRWAVGPANLGSISVHCDSSGCGLIGPACVTMCA